MLVSDFTAAKKVGPFMGKNKENEDAKITSSSLGFEKSEDRGFEKSKDRGS